MEIILLIIGIILLVVGAALNISINRRRFYRRGPAGLQHFESYGKAVGISFIEKLGKFIAVILILGGLFLTLSYFLLPGVKKEVQQEIKKKNR